MSGEGGVARQVSGAATPPRRTTGGGREAAPVVEPAATPAERHLGDRLAALVDGELDHDARERVLAHLATCDQCRAEAEEQRRTKNVFAAAAAAAPTPPPGLLARLQGLPGLEHGDDPGRGPLAPGTPDLPVMADQRSPLDLPPGLPAVPGGRGGGPGFRIYDFSRAARPSLHRGRRLAFAAAGAFSMAAVALGALPLEDQPPVGRTQEPGAATPAVAGTGGPLTNSPSAKDDPIMRNANAPQTLVSVHQPMRLQTEAPAPPSVMNAPGMPPSPLGLPSGDSADR